MDSLSFLHLLLPIRSTCNMSINNTFDHMITLECSSLCAPIDASFGDFLVTYEWFGWLSRDWHSNFCAVSCWQYVGIICFMGLLLNFHLGSLKLHNHGYYIMGTIMWEKLNDLAWILFKLNDISIHEVGAQNTFTRVTSKVINNVIFKI